MENISCTECGTSNSANLKYCTNCGFALPQAQHTPIPAVTQPPAKEKKRITRSQITGIIIGAIALGVLKFVAFKQPSFDQEMMNTASELNKTCPIMVDSETRLDNAIALPNNVFQYNYTLVNRTIQEIDTVYLRNYITPLVVNGVKTKPEMKVFREHRTTVSYSYRDRNGIFLFQVPVTAAQYQ